MPTPLYSSDSGVSDDRSGAEAEYRSVPNGNIASAAAVPKVDISGSEAG